MRIVIINKSPKNLKGPIQNSLFESGVKVLDHSEYSQVSEGDSVLFFSGGQEQDAINKTISRLPKKITIGWWMCDYRKIGHFTKNLYGKFNHIFLPYKNFFNDYKKLGKDGVWYMPQSGYAFPHVDTNIGDYDAVFIGGTGTYSPYHKNRPSLLKTIGSSCKLKIITGQGTSVDQTEIYSKIPLSISISGDFMIGGCSNRLYNIMAAGGCAFVKYFEDLELIFENHKHLVWFKSNEEIKPLIQEYLKSPKKINQIKVNAKNLFLEKHTGKCRVDNMFDIMENKIKKFNGYL